MILLTIALAGAPAPGSPADFVREYSVLTVTLIGSLVAIVIYLYQKRQADRERYNAILEQHKTALAKKDTEAAKKETDSLKNLIDYQAQITAKENAALRGLLELQAKNMHLAIEDFRGATDKFSESVDTLHGRITNLEGDFHALKGAHEVMMRKGGCHVFHQTGNFGGGQE